MRSIDDLPPPGFKSLGIDDLPPPTSKLVNDEHVKAHEKDGVIEKLKDPARWQAILNNTGPYAQDVVAGTAPMVIPGSAIPKLTKAATALSEGKGLGYLIGRTGLATGQGAVMSAMDGQEGESIKDKFDRIKSGAKISGAVQLGAEAIPVVGKGLGYVGRKLGGAISGVDENILSNYAKRTNEVNEIIKQSGGDMTAAADQVRSELSSGIQKTKSELNSKISKTLESSSPENKISVEHILESLEKAKSKLNPNFKASAISEIDDIISSIKKEAPDGLANASSLYQIKQFLNEASASAYNKGGQIFTRASEAARAAKDAGQGARKSILEIAPEISAADQQLSKLHQIERRLNKNLLAPGKPDAALFSAGSGANPRNAATLRELERVSGVPVSQRSMDLATAKTFANPSLTPSDFTGKIVGRMALGAGLGYAAGGNEGAAVGGALASPFAMKLGINGVTIAKELTSKIPSFSGFIRENPVAAQSIVQLISGQIRDANQLPKEARDYIEKNPILLNNKENTNQERSPSELKGESLWIKKGSEKVGITIPSPTRAQKALLIEASDLPANSKKLQTIKNKLTARGN